MNFESTHTFIQNTTELLIQNHLTQPVCKNKLDDYRSLRKRKEKGN